jgi:hypothetical protein
MPAAAVGATWSLVREDRAAVLAALKRGECDGLLPVASEFMDDFAQFLDERGLLRRFEQFPDGRRRCSISLDFLCNTLLHKALLRLPSLAQIGPVLFHSPGVLRRLGFNLRQVHEGFYQGGAQRPFDPEALAGSSRAPFSMEKSEKTAVLLGRYNALLAAGWSWERAPAGVKRALLAPCGTIEWGKHKGRYW